VYAFDLTDVLVRCKYGCSNWVTRVFYESQWVLCVAVKLEDVEQLRKWLMMSHGTARGGRLICGGRDHPREFSASHLRFRLCTFFPGSA